MWKLIPFLMLLTSCTYSINMIHSEGVASDMIDEDQAAKGDLALEIPLK